MKTVAKVACLCKHEQQDKMYGSGIRVANLTQKGTGNMDTRYVRCTVCSKEHLVAESRLSK
jgi:hypothetical protein